MLRANRWATVKYQITALLPEWLRRIREQRCGVTLPGGALRARTGMSKRVNEVKREARGSQRMWSVNYEKGRLKPRQRQLWEASWRRGQSISANREPSHIHLNLKATIENTVISAGADSLDSQIISFFSFSLVDVLSFWFYPSTSSACRFFAEKLKLSSHPQTSTWRPSVCAVMTLPQIRITIIQNIWRKLLDKVIEYYSKVSVSKFLQLSTGSWTVI